MLGYQLEQDIKPLLWRERPIESSIGIFGFLERAEDSDLLVLTGHDLIIGGQGIAVALPGPGPRR
jgi:hypothetical protein